MGNKVMKMNLVGYSGSLEEFDIIAKEVYIVGKDILKMNGLDPATLQEKTIFYRMETGDQVIATGKNGKGNGSL
jgi:hypothetical protein